MTSEGVRLSEMIHQKVEEFAELCGGLNEDTASRSPEGRWSPKQIVSHLCGPEGVGYTPTVQAILEQDTPRLDIEAENPFFTEKRARMTFAELLEEMRAEYGRMAKLVSGLSEEQLARKALIPMLKETPMGEYPTLAMWVGAIAQHHINFHIDHMKEILQALGVASAR